jgi:hypothetical protein
MADRCPCDPAQRMDQAVLAQGIQDRYWLDVDLAQFAGHQNLTWWIVHLRQAETSIRRFRRRLEVSRRGGTGHFSGMWPKQVARSHGNWPIRWSARPMPRRLAGLSESVRSSFSAWPRGSSQVQGSPSAPT